MEATGFRKNGVGLVIGLFTAVIAVVVLLAGKHPGQGIKTGSYDGWYDGLGV